MAAPLLKVENLEAGYDDVQVLWGVSLQVERGGVTTLVGANGAGKTTSLRAITGSIWPRAGRVMFDGEDVTGFRRTPRRHVDWCWSPKGDNYSITCRSRKIWKWAPIPLARGIISTSRSSGCSRCFRV